MSCLYPLIYDLILIAAVLVFLLVGRKRGAARMIFLIVGTLFALAAASALSTTVAQFFFDSFMRSKLIDSVTQVLPDTSSFSELFSAISSDSPIVASLLMLLGADELAQFDSILLNANDAAAQKIVDNILKPVILELLRSISFIIIFIILIVIIKLIARALGLLNKAPVIGGANRFAGALLGVMFGLIAVISATIPLGLLLPSASGNGFLSETAVKNSLVYRHIYSLVQSNLFN